VHGGEANRQSGFRCANKADSKSDLYKPACGALAFDPAKIRQAGFCLPIHTEKIDRIAELGGNGNWWIDTESAVTDSRYRGRCGPGTLRSSSAGIDRGRGRFFSPLMPHAG